MTDPKIIDTLKAIIALLEKPINWHKGSSARNKLGENVSIFSSEACSFCLSGAAIKTVFPRVTDLNVNEQKEMIVIITDLIKRKLNKNKMAYMHLSHFNDNPHTTHKDVINLLDDILIDYTVNGDKN